MCNSYSTPNPGRDVEEGETNYNIALANIKDAGCLTSSLTVIAVAVTCVSIVAIIIYCLFKNCCHCCKKSGGSELKWSTADLEKFREAVVGVTKEVHNLEDMQAAAPEMKEKYVENKVDSILQNHGVYKGQKECFWLTIALLILIIGVLIGSAITYVILHIQNQPDEISEKKGNIQTSFRSTRLMC